MSQEKEVPKNTLCEDILHSKEDSLGIDAQLKSKCAGSDGTRKSA